MSDLIDRQAAIDEVGSWLEDRMTDGKNGKPLTDRLKDLPSAQPERKTGEWIEHNPHKWGLGIKFECSECGYEVDCEEPNYCPNCGADMRDPLTGHMNSPEE